MAFLTATVLLASGCRTYPKLLPASTRVAVVPFTIAEDAKIANYNAPYDSFGRELADWVVQRMRDRHREAEVATGATVANADIIISGEITRISGGSAAKRSLIGWGAGHATFAVMGEVRRRDGTRIAVFSDERIGGGWGNVAALENARQRVGNSLSDMIFQGEYRGGHPGSPGFLVRATPKNQGGPPMRSATDRMHELDELKAKGRVTDEEYREKRRQIINEL